MADGAQAGALTLIAVAAVVLAGIARFAWRLWVHERGTALAERLR